MTAPFLVTPPAGGVPNVQCLLALTTNPTATPDWADVTAYVEAFGLQRGRQSELDTPQAGTCSIVLNNRDRRFDPTYTAGPYYGTLLPMRRVWLRAGYGGAAYDLFHGYVQRWPQTWEGYEDARVTLQATDALGVLGHFELNGAFGVQQSGERINVVLDAAGWQTGTGWVLDESLLDVSTTLGPVSDRNIPYGNSGVQAAVLANTNALAHVQEVERTEAGLFFAAKDGTLTFHPRHRRLGSAAQTPFATFGEQAGNNELPYRDVVLEYDDARLWNDVRVTRTGGVQQTAADPAAQAAYFVRTYSLNTLLNSDAEALSEAQYLLARYKQPATRVTALTVSGYEPAGTVWPQLLGREMGDCVLVRRRPPATGLGGPAIEQRSWIEGLRLGWTARDGWGDAQWSLSPVDPAGYWTLDESLLDVSTTLAW